MAERDQPPPDPAGDDVQLTAQYLVDYIEDPYGDAASDIAMIERYVSQQTAALRADLQREIEAHAATRTRMQGTIDILDDTIGAVTDERDQARADIARIDRALAEAAHVAVELEAMRSERDAAVAIARDVTERAAACAPTMREAADRIRQLETELQALADAHADLIAIAVQTRTQRDEAIEQQRQAQANLETMALQVVTNRTGGQA